MNAGEPPGSRAQDDALSTFCRTLLDDHRLAARLGGFEAPADFVEAARALAEEQGIGLRAEEIEVALGPRSLRDGVSGAPAMLDHWPGPGWVPAHSAAGGDAPAFDWIWIGRRPPTEPFYEDTIRIFRGRPLNRLVRGRTSLETLTSDSRAHAARTPDGFIFHMSRCGSTLLSQMLAQPKTHLVISEAEPLDAVVQWAASAEAAPAAAALQAIVKALGRNRDGTTGRLFVKLDSWHTLALPLLRNAFPTTPWLFLYREPLAVVASHMRLPGRHVAQGALPFDVLGIEGPVSMSREEYCARALARICSAAVDHRHLGGGLLLNYSELGGAIPARVSTHFGLTPTSSETTAMVSVSKYHSKTKAPFSADSSDGRAASPAAMRRAADIYLRPLFDRLELARQNARLSR